MVRRKKTNTTRYRRSSDTGERLDDSQYGFDRLNFDYLLDCENGVTSQFMDGTITHKSGLKLPYHNFILSWTLELLQVHGKIYRTNADFLEECSKIDMSADDFRVFWNSLYGKYESGDIASKIKKRSKFPAGTRPDVALRAMESTLEVYFKPSFINLIGMSFLLGKNSILIKKLEESVMFILERIIDPLLWANFLSGEERLASFGEAIITSKNCLKSVLSLLRMYDPILGSDFSKFILRTLLGFQKYVHQEMHDGNDDEDFDTTLESFFTELYDLISAHFDEHYKRERFSQFHFYFSLIYGRDDVRLQRAFENDLKITSHYSYFGDSLEYLFRNYCSNILGAVQVQEESASLTTGFVKLTRSPSSQFLQPNFVVTIEGSNHTFHVHDFILCQWSYFINMMRSNLEETKLGIMTLPHDFSLSILRLILRALYNIHPEDEITSPNELYEMENGDLDFIITNAVEYGLIDPPKNDYTFDLMSASHDLFDGFKSKIVACPSGQPTSSSVATSSSASSPESFVSRRTVIAIPIDSALIKPCQQNSSRVRILFHNLVVDCFDMKKHRVSMMKQFSQIRFLTGVEVSSKNLIDDVIRIMARSIKYVQSTTRKPSRSSKKSSSSPYWSEDEKGEKGEEDDDDEEDIGTNDE